MSYRKRNLVIRNNRKYGKREEASLVSLSKSSKSSAHHLSDTNRFDVLSKGPFVGTDEGPLLETSNLFVSLRQ